MSSLAGSLARAVSPPSYAVAPLAAYEEWHEGYRQRHPRGGNLQCSAAILRRIVMLRRAGDSFAEIARCCGLTAPSAKAAYAGLPEGLR